MGQLIFNSPLPPLVNLDDWLQISILNKSTIWRNKRTKEEIEEYLILCNTLLDYNTQIDALNFRFNHPYLVSSKYILNTQGQNNMRGIKSKYQTKVYLQRIKFKLGDISNYSFVDSLHIYDQTFKGFQSIVPYLGYFAVKQDMICLNSNNIIKIWPSSNLMCISQITENLKSEVEMIASIINIIQRNINKNRESVAIRQFFRKHNVKTFNEAIQYLQQFANQNNLVIPNRISHHQNQIKNIKRKGHQIGCFNQIKTFNNPVNSSNLTTPTSIKSNINIKDNLQYRQLLNPLNQINSTTLLNRKSQLASPFKRQYNRISLAKQSTPLLRTHQIQAISIVQINKLSKSPIMKSKIFQKQASLKLLNNLSPLTPRVERYGDGHTDKAIWDLINSTKSEIAERNNNLFKNMKRNSIVYRSPSAPHIQQNSSLNKCILNPQTNKLVSTTSNIHQSFKDPKMIKQYTQIRKKPRYSQFDMNYFNQNLIDKNNTNNCLQNKQPLSSLVTLKQLNNPYINVQIGINNQLINTKHSFVGSLSFDQSNIQRIEQYKQYKQQFQNIMNSQIIYNINNNESKYPKIVTQSTQSLINKIKQSKLFELDNIFDTQNNKQVINDNRFVSNYPSNDYTNNGLWQSTNVYQSYTTPNNIISTAGQKYSFDKQLLGNIQLLKTNNIIEQQYEYI